MSIQAIYSLKLNNLAAEISMKKVRWLEELEKCLQSGRRVRMLIVGYLNFAVQKCASFFNS